MSFLKPSTPNVPAPVLPAAPPPVMAPQGTKPNKKPQQSTFLGAGDIANPVGPSGMAQGGKTLLGQ